MSLKKKKVKIEEWSQTTENKQNAMRFLDGILSEKMNISGKTTKIKIKFLV